MFAFFAFLRLQWTMQWALFLVNEYLPDSMGPPPGTEDPEMPHLAPRSQAVTCFGSFLFLHLVSQICLQQKQKKKQKDSEPFAVRVQYTTDAWVSSDGISTSQISCATNLGGGTTILGDSIRPLGGTECGKEANNWQKQPTKHQRSTQVQKKYLVLSVMCRRPHCCFVATIFCASGLSFGQSCFLRHIYIERESWEDLGSVLITQLWSIDNFSQEALYETKSFCLNLGFLKRPPRREKHHNYDLGRFNRCAFYPLKACCGTESNVFSCVNRRDSSEYKQVNGVCKRKSQTFYFAAFEKEVAFQQTMVQAWRDLWLL